MSDSNYSTQTAPADHHSSTAIDWMEMLRQVYDQQLRQAVAIRLSGGHEHQVDDIMRTSHRRHQQHLPS